MTTKTTPASRTANRPQPVRRSLPGPEQTTLSISTQARPEELQRLLHGISAFASSFVPEDQYIVTIEVEKLPKERVKDGAGRISDHATDKV